MSDKSKNVSRETIRRASFTVDWMTGTTNVAYLRDALSKAAHAHIDLCIAQKEYPSLWEHFGYRGWDVGGIRWGRREQDDLIQLRGDQADKRWSFFLPLLTNVSRLDLAATIQYSDHLINKILDHYEEVQSVAEELPIIRNYSMITSLKGGDTLYVGRRASQQFGRIYDKGMQSTDPEFANCIRYEVELKRPAAWPVAQLLASSADSEQLISSFIFRWFEDRLIACDWSPKIAYNAIQFPRRQTDVEQQLKWLQSQVAPTVRRLLDLGLSQDVFNALALAIDITVEDD